ncbi:hypothetical protein BH23CHL6_BH23CHL6_05940 [soil metagenome]
MHDIDIRLSRSEDPDGSCRVSITGPDDRRADGLFRSPFSPTEIDDALAWMDLGTANDAPAKAQVREFGERLFRSLFQGAVAGVFVASRNADSPPRVRMTVDDPVAARIPWELLVDPSHGEALAFRSRFVRGISTEGGARRLIVDPPLRVLVVDSAPRGLPRLESQLEARGIADALRSVVAQGRVELVTLEHATLSRMLDALREGSTDRPPRPFHVLHWIGHGDIDSSGGANVLLFEDDNGNPDPVDGARLANVVVGSELRLVLINACHSAAPTSSSVATPAAETTRAIAEVLLTAGIPAVVGMRVAVLDETARRFAREFYAALADGRGVDDAVLDARVLVAGRGSDASAEIGVPVAYLRSGSGRLLSTVSPLTWWQAPLVRFRRLSPLARAAVFVAIVIATLAVERSFDAVVRAIEGPPRMTASLNVVVTDFDGRDSSGRPIQSNAASDLSEDLAKALDEDLSAVAQSVDVRFPDVAGRLGGATAEERALAASQLAERINADIVLYGSLDATKTTLQPEFFVREARLADAEELTGAFRLGSPIEQPLPIDTNGAARTMMSSALVSRGRALAEVIAGLDYFRLSDYVEAERRFDIALSAEGWPDGDGKEVLYVFRGTTAGARGELDEAEAWFLRALDLNGSFARARLGLAEVAFQRAKGLCEVGEVNGDGLHTASELYREAIPLTDDPASASNSAKARLGAARVYLCISQAGLADRWQEAADEAAAVIAAYDAGDASLQQLTAEAHAVRAIAALPTAGAPDAAARFADAEREYRLAINLGTQPDRRAAYHAALAYVLQRLGRIDEARREYDEAIRLAPEEDRPVYEDQRRQLGADVSAPRAVLQPAGFRPFADLSPLGGR